MHKHRCKLQNSTKADADMGGFWAAATGLMRKRSPKPQSPSFGIWFVGRLRGRASAHGAALRRVGPRYCGLCFLLNVSNLYESLTQAPSKLTKN